MVFTLLIKPANIFDSLIDFLTSETVKLFDMGLKLSVILKNALFFLVFFASVKDNNSASMVSHCKKITSVVEFDDTDEVFFLDFFPLTLVAEHLGEFVIWFFTHSSNFYNSQKHSKI